jgi:NTE family protein
VRPKIGLILGGGAARGYSHLGILKRLEEENIPVDFIIGTSIGALIGALYASGNDIDDLLFEAKDMTLSKFAGLLDLSVPRKGLVKGDKIEQYLSEYIKKDFSELQIPLYIVAADLESKKGVVFFQGSVIKAVRASIAIPGIFEPVEMQQLKLVDGSILKLSVEDFAAKLGADIIINVDVSSNIDIGGLNKAVYVFNDNLKKIRLDIKNQYLRGRYVGLKRMLPEIFPVILTTLNMMNLPGYEKNKICDKTKVFTVRPKVGDIRWYRFDCADVCINKGIEAINPVLRDITCGTVKFKK